MAALVCVPEPSPGGLHRMLYLPLTVMLVSCKLLSPETQQPQLLGASLRQAAQSPDTARGADKVMHAGSMSSSRRATTARMLTLCEGTLSRNLTSGSTCWGHPPEPVQSGLHATAPCAQRGHCQTCELAECQQGSAPPCPGLWKLNWTTEAAAVCTPQGPCTQGPCVGHSTPIPGSDQQASPI